MAAGDCFLVRLRRTPRNDVLAASGLRNDVLAAS